ncbi:hypothetical protein PVL30_004571 [Lodderomyces elongisporus]|uniref:uncharacterized protein n=1 Tax=Lodderomyces elongisporus TaxID=36914 RepID=UPI00291EF83A|nr:uncharacterized protein PVL30_004571 [Lodderomyces elongisporus]WLF80782.1 hypothetical protein PVL30_004571 [Lodderomyces elongisporus]
MGSTDSESEESLSSLIETIVHINDPNLAPTNTTASASSLQTLKGDRQLIYPEAILQASEKGNKIYASLQSTSPEFIDEPSTATSILRWHDSNLQAVQQIIVESWSHQKVPEKQSVTAQSTAQIKRAGIGLFSWASSDAYVKSRKFELQLLRGNKNGKSVHSPSLSQSSSLSKSSSLSQQQQKDSIESTDDIESSNDIDFKKQSLQSSLNLKTPSKGVNNKLSKVIEKESGKFMHYRIQDIRRIHTEKLLQQINERKRRDYESYLKKLKLKEEEYEKSLREESLSHSHAKSNFLGNLFSFGQSSGNKRVPEQVTGTSESFKDEGEVFGGTKNNLNPITGLQALFSKPGAKSATGENRKIMFDADEADEQNSVEAFANNEQSFTNSNKGSTLENDRDRDQTGEESEEDKVVEPENLPININILEQSLGLETSHNQQQDTLQNFQLSKVDGRSDVDVDVDVDGDRIGDVDYDRDGDDNDENDDDDFTDFTSASPSINESSQVSQSVSPNNVPRPRKFMQVDDTVLIPTSTLSPMRTSPAPADDVNLLDL